MRPRAVAKRRVKNKIETQKADLELEYKTFYMMLHDENSTRMAQASAVCYFRRLFTENTEPPTYFKDELIDILLEFMGDKARPNDVRTEAAWTITNLLCSKKMPLTHRILQHGGMDVLVDGVAFGDGRYRDQCIWAIGNIAADCLECKEAVRNITVLDHIADQLSRAVYSNSEAYRSAIWCCLNALRGGNAVFPPRTGRTLMTGIARAIHAHSRDTQLIQDSLYTLSFLADDRNFIHFPAAWPSQVDAMIAEPGLIDVAIEAIASNNASLMSPSLRLLGNIITGTDFQTDAIVQKPKFIEIMVKCILHSSSQVRREAAWIISNVAAGPSDHVDLLTMNSEMLTALLRVFHDEDAKLRKEICWIFINLLSSFAVHNRPTDLEEILGYGVLRVCQYLCTDNVDARLVRKAAEVLGPLLDRHPEWRSSVGAFTRHGDDGNAVKALYRSPKRKAAPFDFVLRDS